MNAWQYAVDNAPAFAAFGALFGSLVSVYFSIRNGGKINTVAVRIDGRMEDLLEVTKELAAAQGKEVGRDQEMLRRAEAVAVVKEAETPPSPKV